MGCLGQWRGHFGCVPRRGTGSGAAAPATVRTVPREAVSWEIGWRYCRPMESEKSNGCLLPEVGAAAQSLVGPLLAEIAGSQHVYDSDDPAGRWTCG